MTRRAFLRATAVAGAVLALPLRFSSRALAAAAPRFFTKAERRTLEALCDRILPPDEDPGAKALGAAGYIETLLTAFDGGAPFLYAGGPFSGRTPFASKKGKPSDRRPKNAFRTPLALSRLQELAWRAEILGSDAAGLPDALVAQRGGAFPGLRDVYRQGLAAVDQLAVDQDGKLFAALKPAQQDALVALLDTTNAITFPGRSETFLDVVIRHVLEGCFSAPEYGGNRGRRGWKLVGIEGDSQPLGYSLYAEASGDYNELKQHPMSTPNPDEIGKSGALAPRPLSADGTAIQDAIAEYAGFLESHVPGACSE